MIHGVGFRADIAEYLAQHDLVFEKESRTWESGLLIGNGDLGAMHYLPQSPIQLQWLLNKTDIWDVNHHFNMDPQPYGTHADVMEAVTANRKVVFGQFDKPCFPHRSQNTPKNAALLRIGPWGLSSAENTSYLVYQSEMIEECRQRLRLADGVAETDLAYQGTEPPTHIESSVQADRNVLIIDVKNPPPGPVEIYRWTDDTFGYPPESFAEDGYFGIEYTFPPVPTIRPQPYPALHDHFRYAVVARIVGPRYRTFRYANRAIADFEFPTHQGFPLPGPLPDYTIYVAVVTSMESDSPRAAARQLLDEAIRNGRRELQERHQRKWLSFWEKSLIDIPDKNLENLWYFTIYQLACCSRGKLLPGIGGLWFGPDLLPGHYDGVFCQGAYTQDQNTTSPHYFTLAANHPELLDNYLDTFTRLVPMAKTLTREMFGIEGMHMPLTNTPLGIETTPFHGRYNFISSPQAALLFWMHYDYVKDRTVLKEIIYPFLKESSLFFLNYMQKGPDGKYLLYPCYPSEQSRELGFERNPTGTLMMLKALLTKTREFCRVLNVDPELEARVGEMLDHFPEYPVGQGCFLQSEDEPDPSYHRHPSRVEAGFYCGEIDPDTPNPLREALIGALRAIAGNDEWRLEDAASWQIFYIGGNLAYLKWPEEVLKHLYGFAIAHCLKPNGMLCQDALYGKNIADRQEVSAPVFEGNGGVASTIAEMLLQSYGETIHVFPCVPDAWRQAGLRIYNLRARGAFLVEAAMADGQMDYVSIFSEKGCPCRVRNPWPGMRPAVFRMPGPNSFQPHQFEIQDDLVAFSTAPDTRYVLCRTDPAAIAATPTILRACPAEKPRRIVCPGGQTVSLGRFRT